MFGRDNRGESATVHIAEIGENTCHLGDRETSMGVYWVYMLRCVGGELYTGYTKDVGRRFLRHQRGQASRFTRARRPLELVFAEKHHSLKVAMKRERAIKRLSRRSKEGLIAAHGNAVRRESGSRSTKKK